MLDIYRYGDEVLREPTRDVTKFDDALAMLVDAMFDTMIEADGVGLAGPQVGVSSRLFVVDTRREGEETSDDSVPYEEGCLSIPGVYHDVMRPSRIVVRAQDVDGRHFTLEAGGLLARVIQHEYDHLEGRLFVDRLDDEEKAKVVAQYEKRSRGKRKHR